MNSKLFTHGIVIFDNMHHFSEQLIADLEFTEIRERLMNFAQQPHAKFGFEKLEPIRNNEKWRWTLNITQELVQVSAGDFAFPALQFIDFESDLKLLRIRDAVLSEEGFMRILQACQVIASLKQLPNEMISAYSNLFGLIDSCKYSDAIEKSILQIFDAKWKVKDDASPELASIRHEIALVRREIAKNFQRVMKDLQSKGFLGDTGESYLHDRRVLSVLSVYKRKVAGNVLGTSKTGALTYIEPQANLLLNSQLEMFFGDERDEIRKILQRLTRYLSNHQDELNSILKTLRIFDELQARMRLAQLLDAQLPKESEEIEIHLEKAYHPLLFLKNKERNMPTIPQTVTLNAEQRMLVISGPNAGGKSITLKTVGLIQLMWECALLVPVAESSKMSRFHSVLTDIGDHQSIENQLSTYSYRLKRMKFFLEHANRRTLVLLDEFGTGSDPELGGALAEVFFEELYGKKTFGVITTHFSPIKVKASQLRNAVNGCMLFDTLTLAPTYQLSMGEPGSSFTFEVAKMNGISEDLLNRARKKVDGKKVKMDQLLSDLQRQKTELQLTMKLTAEQHERARREEEGFKGKLEKLELKLERQQLLSDRNNKYLHLGKKMDTFVGSFVLRSKNKELLEEIKKFIAMEKTNRMESAQKKKAETEIRQRQDKKKKLVQDRTLMIQGATVRLERTRQVGEIIDVLGETATVAFGNFKTKVELNKLILIP
ncbi:MAG: DNA mismatch repair protein MutS [Bacteroidetes bacterium]|nr:DNA mismatch repair protein MutS [Bacteroidota bacterium]